MRIDKEIRLMRKEIEMIKEIYDTFKYLDFDIDPNFEEVMEIISEIEARDYDYIFYKSVEAKLESLTENMVKKHQDKSEEFKRNIYLNSDILPKMLEEAKRNGFPPMSEIQTMQPISYANPSTMPIAGVYQPMPMGESKTYEKENE